MNRAPRPVPAPLPAGDDLLSLARSRAKDARDRLNAYEPEQLAGALVGLPPRQRAEFLELAERAPEIVPHLPEAVFATTVVATGIEDAGWLARHATAEQRVAAVDLDCWKDRTLSPSRLFEWIDALIAAGPETLVAAFEELDPELWIVAMKEMADFAPPGGETEGLTSEDGFAYYEPRSAEHEERLRTLLGIALLYAPRHYWNLVHGAVLESRVECELFAAQWQRSRLNDLGFPDRDRAMRTYRPLRPDALELPPAALQPDDGARTDLVVRAQPPAVLDGTLVGRTLAELPPERAAEIFEAVLAVANALAVADKLPLADPDSVSASLRKALRGIERGLAEVARLRDRPLAEVLDGAPAKALFRVGAALDPELRPKETLADLTREEEGTDWNVRTEVIDAWDRTLGEDGTLRK